MSRDGHGQQPSNLTQRIFENPLGTYAFLKIRWELMHFLVFQL
jgi:hypothetical protein